MSENEKGRKREAESGGREGSGGGDVEVTGGRDSEKGVKGDGGKDFAFGRRFEKKKGVDAGPSEHIPMHHSGAPKLSYRDKLLSPGCAGFLVKHSEEDDIVKGWKEYFHKMNEIDANCVLEESDEDENQSTRRLEGKPGIIRFTAEEYTAWCLPWMNSLIIKGWRPNFNPWKADLQCNIAAWIRLLDVPFEFYNVESLRRIGNMIGRMIKVDRSTSIYEKGGFARICVEIDLKQPLLPSYVVFGEERSIIYEGLHQVYFECRKYGHQKEGCSLRKTDDHGNKEAEQTVEGSDGGENGKTQDKEPFAGGDSTVTTGTDRDGESPFGKLRILRCDFRGAIVSAAGRPSIDEKFPRIVDQDVARNKGATQRMMMRDEGKKGNQDIKGDLVKERKEAKKGNQEVKRELVKERAPQKFEWIQVGSKRKNANKGKAKGKENRPPLRDRVICPQQLGLEVEPSFVHKSSELSIVDQGTSKSPFVAFEESTPRFGQGSSTGFSHHEDLLHNNPYVSTSMKPRGLDVVTEPKSNVLDHPISLDEDIGTGARSFPSLVRDLKSHYHLDFIAILETRCSNKPSLDRAKQLGFSNMALIECEGYSGGIWCLWEPSILQVSVLERHHQYMHLQITSAACTTCIHGRRIVLGNKTFLNFPKRALSGIKKCSGTQREGRNCYCAGWMLPKYEELQLSLWKELEDVLLQESLLWAQKARAEWSVYGDRNTRYFHAHANRRQKSKKIEAMKDDMDLGFLTLGELKICGAIPKELGKLSHLQRLYLYTNRLNWTIPPELGNLTSALEIDLSENLLSGMIPRELGQISNLGLLHLFENLLQGEIPWELGQLWLLNTLDLSINSLTGTIPLVFQNLTYMVDLQLFDNQLEGKIPPDLGARSNLSVLDLSANNLIGMIPAHLCKYQKLKFLSLGSNKLSGNVPYDLKTCKSLVQLMLGNNQLTGGLPIELNELHNLSALELHQNRFTGIINRGIGQLQSLMRLLLSDNHFFGHLPPEIGKLAQLVSFNVSSNLLSGSIPDELGNCVKLQRLDLSRNQFTGTLTGAIPSALGDLTRLTELELGGNLFSGSIPLHLGGLAALQIALNMSHNKLSGVIPDSLGNLQMLEFLYLNDNELVGEIPTSIGNLPSLLVCNVSNNNLTGTIPNTPAFQKMDFTNFAGNNGLCHVGSSYCHSSKSPPSPPNQSWTRDGSSREMIVSIVSGVVGLVSLTFIICICWAMKRKSPSFVSLERQAMPHALNNYYFPKEGFTYQDLLEATGNFSEAAIIGNGACGTVYRATMADGEVIAVKKLNSSGERANVDRSFLAEISTLGKIRHRNIVKLYGFCFHEDSKILLYEYMENGSLGEQLHANPESCPLDWNCRYKIALGAAQGLCYLHYDCKPQIIHRDIKSNNILLDENFQARVGDFGLAKLIDFSYSKSMTTVAGSFGYIAPEYAYTMKVTEKCDIYSLGVVLLELVSGRSPVQPLEQGGDLVTWVRRSIQASVPTLELFDKRLNLSEQRTVEEMSLVLKIALFCTSASPLNRPTMKEVIAMLIDAREYVSNSSSVPTSESPHDT
ncbi:hypothetical protein K1719_031068 [Acacia pycnantha]|nr:hypothetical protein K1719_031068 [Acacia pycnantha]